MTVQTDQLDMNQGFGMAAMQSSFITRRGTNEFHGQVFWDHRNDNLNANTWYNNARGVRRPELILNEFGGSVGGPIRKDKLFFFFSLSTARRPGSSTRSSTFLTQSAQLGNFTYVGSDGQTRTVNVFTVAKNFDSTLPGSVNSVIATQLQRINKAVTQGSVTTTTNPIINNVSWLSTNPQISWFPTFRVDYTPTQKWRINLAVNQTKVTAPYSGAPFFPGDEFVKIAGGSKSNRINSSLGIDWSATSTFINSFRFGFLYPPSWNPWSEDPEFFGYLKNPESVAWPLVTTPMTWRYPISNYYPVFTIADSVSWQKGAHMLSFGFSAYREQDRYWNRPEPTDITLGLVTGDPALDALTNAGSYQPLPFASTAQQADARSLYALLDRAHPAIQRDVPYDQEDRELHPGARAPFRPERGRQGGGRLHPGHLAHAAQPDDQRRFPLGFHRRQLRQERCLSQRRPVFHLRALGHRQPVQARHPDGQHESYARRAPAPVQQLVLHAAAVAGNRLDPAVPRKDSSRRLLGGDDTVIRTSFSLRNFTVPYQYFWNNATNYGGFYYQFYTAEARNIPGPGSFAPGSKVPWGTRIRRWRSIPRNTKSPPRRPSSPSITINTRTASTGWTTTSRSRTR
jgi:hypothetical protein